MPSELLQGEEATSSGIVNGSFFNGSALSPTRYNEPSRGSGSRTGMIASLVSKGTLTIGSTKKTSYSHAKLLKTDILSLIFHRIRPVCCSMATKLPSSVAKINNLASFSLAISVLSFFID